MSKTDSITLWRNIIQSRKFSAYRKAGYSNNFYEETYRRSAFA
jgi:hypothetical protein